MAQNETPECVNTYHPGQILQEVTEKCKFPVVIRTLQEYRNHSADGETQIQPGTIIYLECIKKLQFVHIKVLDVLDEEEATKLHGSDFIYERGIYLGEEFLIPFKYPGTLKFEHRPGRRTRYASIAQVAKQFFVLFQALKYPLYIYECALYRCDNNT